MSKLSNTIRKMNCNGDLAQTVAIFELADAVDMAVDKAEMVDDMAELFGCEWVDVYSKVALAFEAKAKPEMGQVFTSAKEDLKDWPEDLGEHPQRGVVK